MIAHQLQKEALRTDAGAKIVETLILAKRNWSTDRIEPPKRYFYRVAEEFPLTIAPYTKEHGRYGTRRLDALIHVSLMKGSIFYNDSFDVAIEIKTSRDDLKGDMKMFEYLGYSDYMLLIVPTILIPSALSKVADYDTIGVADIDTGKVYKLPEKQEISMTRRKINADTLISYYHYLPPVYERVLGSALLGFSQTKPNSDKETEVYYRQCSHYRYDQVAEMVMSDDEDRLEAFYACTQRYCHKEFNFLE